jgi:hypothetical protein
MLICWNNFFIFSVILFFYIIIDLLLGKYVKGKYYLLHFINNIIVVYYTYKDTILIYVDFNNYILNDGSEMPIIITVALHIYHIILYYNILRFDDWLHHILMIFILLPLSIYLDAGILLNHGLFFLTGLPGGIDYFLLFLNRNNIISKITEKKINTKLNLWIRCPGCISHTVLSILCISIRYKTEVVDQFQLFLSFFSAFLVYWNGIYFLNQVVSNYATNQYILNNNKD